jgi:hypothetical protein
MADSTTWAERVAAWQASGLSARAFASGKGYTAGALYYWPRRGQESRRKGTGIAFARVVRTRAPDAGAAGTSTAAGSATPLVLEFGGARLIVRPGFDRGCLCSILDALEERIGRVDS